MPKLTYLLINTENMGHETPLAVSGYSGKLYGHAQFDPAHGAHVFRVDAKDYEGDMDLDIAKGMHRRLQRWKIRAELENDAPTIIPLDDAGLPEIPPFSSVVPPMEQLPPVGSAKVINPDGTAVVLPLVKGAPDLPAHPKSLEKMIADENAKGADIQIKGSRTTVKLRAALAEHFAKQAAA